MGNENEIVVQRSEIYTLGKSMARLEAVVVNLAEDMKNHLANSCATCKIEPRVVTLETKFLTLKWVAWIISTVIAGMALKFIFGLFSLL